MKFDQNQPIIDVHLRKVTALQGRPSKESLLYIDDPSLEINHTTTSYNNNNVILTCAGEHKQSVILSSCIFSESLLQFNPVACVKRLPLWCNVGCYHGVGTRIRVCKIRIWSQITSGTKLVGKLVVIFVKCGLIGSVVSINCFWFLIGSLKNKKQLMSLVS